jgi:hypothetical protein
METNLDLAIWISERVVNNAVAQGLVAEGFAQLLFDRMVDSLETLDLHVLEDMLSEMMELEDRRKLSEKYPISTVFYI